MLWLSVLMVICRTSPSVERGFVEVYSKLTPIPLQYVLLFHSVNNKTESLLPFTMLQPGLVYSNRPID